MLSRKKKTIINQVHTSEPPVPVAQYVPNGGRGRKSVPETLKRDEASRSNPAQILAADNINNILNSAIPKLGNLISAPDSPERTRELKKLQLCLNDISCLNDQTFIGLVEVFKSSVDHHDENITVILQRIYDSNWVTRSSKAVKLLEDFTSELLTIQPSFCGSAIRSMIMKFLPLSESTVPEEITLSDHKRFTCAIKNLEKILHSFPKMKDSCVKSMGALYPYMGKPPYVHYCYVFNMLRIAKDLPELKSSILHLIIHKLCRIDVNVPREDVEEISELHAAEEAKLPTSMLKREEGGVMDLELEADPSKEFNPLVTVLDVCLKLIFEFLEANPFSNEDCFQSFCTVFEKEILPTFGVGHVQFVFFYMACGSKDYIQMFLDFLWARATCFNTPPIYRIQCMSYIAGFLSRAGYISIKIVKRWLSRMAVWAHTYADERVNGCHWSSVNINAHGFFYAVCQAIFYVFAFRNKDLIGSRKCIAFTNTLNLGRLVTCDLNPLKACVQPVAEAFVNAAHFHQISYCRTVLERNQRATIPTIVSRTMDTMDTEMKLYGCLESFFPFDPFLLTRSRKWIDPIYSVYEPYLPEVKIEKKPKLESSGLYNPHEEDSIEMELSSSVPKSNGFSQRNVVKDVDDLME